MTIEQQLEDLGLGKNEAIVYSALFGLGRVKAGDIIVETKLHRNLVYTALEKLTKDHLVSKALKEGVAWFWALNPHAMVERVEMKKSLAKKVASELKAKQTAEPLQLKVYEGYNGILEARQAVYALKKGALCYAFGGSEIMYDKELSADWYKGFSKRVERGINLKMLCDVTVPDGYIERKNKQARTAAKRLPIPAPLPALFEVYGDILNITVPGKEPITLSVKSREAAEAMKKFFDFFWEYKNSA
jgi:sugar-specific transcriptional regulator TrmB